MRSKYTIKSNKTISSVAMDASLNDGIASLPFSEHDRTIPSSADCEPGDSFLHSSSPSVDFEVISRGAEMALARAIQGFTDSPSLAIEKGQLGRMLRNDGESGFTSRNAMIKQCSTWLHTHPSGMHRPHSCDFLVCISLVAAKSQDL